MNNNTPLFSKRYKGYVLLILTGVYTFNFIDRQILVILQESIKGELGLSDTQLGLLTGLSFALFYVSLGIPIARLADRSNRRNIVSASLAVWSLMTAVSGFAQNFVQLLLARIGVGIGEAGGSPPAHSIISDYFPAEQRGTALSIYSMGIYFGILLGYIGGGMLDEYVGWRYALMILGLPGIIYALVLLFTVKEPPRGLSDNKIEEEAPDESFGDVLKVLLSKKTFVFLALACGIHTIGNYGVGNFFAPFLARIHGMTAGEIGTWMGLSAGIGGMAGTFLGGFLGDKLAKIDIRWYIWLAVIAELVNFIPHAGAIFLSNTSLVLFFYFISAFLTAIYLGPCLAVTHSLVDAHKRALASAILFLVLNLIGLGGGPLLVGAISDYLSVDYGAESLRYAFCVTFFTGAIALFLFYMASTYYPQEKMELDQN
jgi:predicted MFS family arabinose efflux permease